MTRQDIADRTDLPLDVRAARAEARIAAVARWKAGTANEMRMLVRLAVQRNDLIVAQERLDDLLDYEAAA